MIVDTKPRREDAGAHRLILADMSLRYFLLSQYNEFARLGYPRRAAFAVDIARGTVSLPPPTEDDPINNSVGQFYQSIREIDRRILADHYLPHTGTQKQKAVRVGKSVRGWKRTLERLLEACLSWLRGSGF